MNRRLAFGVALIAALQFFPTAQCSRAQNTTPAPGASSTPSAAQSPAQAPAKQAPSSSPGATLDATQTPPAAPHSQHTVTVTFDYDFRTTPACSKKVTSGCVQQFVAYDISGGMKNATMLFPIPLPVFTKGAVQGITATSPLLDFESGKHLISVTAMGPDGRHSKRNLCTTWIVIP